MTFVNEKISEADSEKAKWEQYPDYQNRWKRPPTFWTIDRDKNTYFWHIKGPIPEYPNQTFGLNLDGQFIYVEAIETVKDVPGVDKRFADFHWDILKIYSVNSNEFDLNHVKNILIETFNVYGDNYRLSNIIHDVSVSFR